MSKNRQFDGHKNNYSEPTTKYPPGGSTGCRVELLLRSVCRASAGNLLMIKKKQKQIQKVMNKVKREERKLSHKMSEQEEGDSVMV